MRDGVGNSLGTANQHESRPALSLAKLYLGYWVLRHGEPGDQARVENMIRFSEDATATDLDRKYPDAIASILRDYQLGDSHYSGYWGTTTTSAADIARFLESVRYDPAAEPMMRGMATASPIAADGYHQDYGTATVPGVSGTKFGWSDNGAINATASIGPGFSLAAHTYEPAGQLTEDVQRAVIPGTGGLGQPLAITVGSSSVPRLLGPAGAPEARLLPPRPHRPGGSHRG